MKCASLLFATSLAAALFASPLRAQSDIITTAVELLNISPSPMQNGMGGAGVALANDDPLSFFFNPAQLGFAARTMNVRQGIYLQKTPWLPTLFRDLFNLNAYALQVGYNFSENLSLPLSVGVGFSRQFFDLGETSVRDANNNFVQTIRSYDISNALSVGASLNWRIQVSAGISLKRISSTSNLISVQNPAQDFTSNATAVDFGVMAIAPILRRHQLGNKFSTSLDVSFGYSQSNIGGELGYTDELADPLPRTARLGYGVSGGIDYELGQVRLELVSGAFTAQVTDILVERFGRLRNDGSFESVVEYQVWGDVNLWDNLIRGRAGSGGVSYEQGWRLSFLETFTIMGGVFRQNQTFFTPTSATSGYVVQSRGLFKVIQPYFANSFARYLFEHIDVQYVRSSLNEGAYQGTVFESLNISIVGLRF